MTKGNPRSARPPSVPTATAGRLVNDKKTEVWAVALIRRGHDVGPVPSYGSDEWHALDTADPRRLAAVVIAAECWRREFLPARVYQRSLDIATALEQVARRQAQADWAPVADYVRRVSYQPTRDELAARRALPKSRPDDYPGQEAS